MSKKKVLKLIFYTFTLYFRTITETIARKIGGDVKKTEAELLSVLLGTSTEQKGNLR